MDKKERILSEAIELFAEKGYYGLGLSELLTRCCIPKGSFYYYFPGGKIQLIQEVLEYSYQRMRTGISSWIFDQPSALAAFTRMADRLATAIEPRHKMPSLLLTMIAIESVYLDPQVNETCRTIYEDWHRFYAEVLTHYGCSEEESRQKAQAVFALIHGSMISAWIKYNPEDLLHARQAIADLLSKE